ncbi:unnamed protein product [Adineta steineri]|uniref:Uncharacterized protein n=1 Tax=Adineta steineri TaxID=433720 RepID=A0A815SR96_9BILA|nr:unnamed protein product [Adineta steineri]
MNIDPEHQCQKIPVLSLKSLSIPPNTSCSVPVSTSISSICSILIPNQTLSYDTSLIPTHTLLNFHNYESMISFSNTSPITQFICRNDCIGVLTDCQQFHSSLILPSKLHQSVDDTKRFGGLSAYTDSHAVLVSKSHSVDAFLPSIANHSLSISSSPFVLCNSIKSPGTPVNIHINSLVESLSNLTQRSQLHYLLTRFSAAFDISEHNIAQTCIHHVINTIPHSPPACKPYPQPDKEPAMYQMMQEFLTAGLITESHSPYAAPAILVKKKDDSYRFVVDYKRLNLVTIKDASPLPNIEDTLRKLGQGYSHFSKLDLKSGFYQIPIRNSDKEKTAFVTPFGLYQFNVLPMGLKNSPPTFQKVMTDTLKSCRAFSSVYLDDIIVFSKSFDEHLQHLEAVLLALRANNLILNPPKCVFAANQIDYLGHTISKHQMTPLQERIDTILAIKEPKTLAQANKFIGSLSWYRKFIPQFATVAAPIHEVTNLTKDKRHKFKWQYAQSKAFQELKHMLVSKPLFLNYPIENIPLMLTTDASGIGIGGVLQQEVNGEIHNLYYHSQVMTPCERKYSTIEKEALAIYKCFTRMRTILLGRSIILCTDHCPLCHIMEKTVHNARVERITHLIQEYNIEKVIHIKGRDNCLPDFLSRYSNDTNDELFEVEYGLENKTALLAAMTLRSHTRRHKISTDDKSIDSDFADEDKSNINTSSESSYSKQFTANNFDVNQLQREQALDPAIQTLIQQISNRTPNLDFILKNDIIYKLITPSRNSQRKLEVIYLPKSMEQSLVQACHDDPMTGAHFSFERTYRKIRYLYWWPSMKPAIKEYLASCLLCKQHNISRHKKYGHLNPLHPPEGPFSMIGIDYCGPLKRTPRENQYVLVITDYFTRHITAIALPNCTAETTAQALFNDFFCKYGIPAVILSDQGSHFKNQLMENIQHLIGYNHIYSTPYHPQTNGIVERFNATFIPQIAKLQDTQDNNWDEFLQPVVFAYNTGVHKTTKYSPYELLYGSSARLPITIRPAHFSFTTPNDYFEQLRKTMRIYHRAAHDNIIHQQQNTKTFYDSNRRDPHYEIGDVVLTRIHGNRSKLDPKFSPIPKVITHVNHPIYETYDEEAQVYSRIHVADLRPILID